MVRTDKRIGYLVALIACTVVLLLRVAAYEVLAEQARLMPFILAVVVAAWWGGLGPGLAATLLSVFLGVLFIVPPWNSLRIDNLADGLNAALFVVIGIAVSYLCEELHSSRSRETDHRFRTLADSIPQLVWMARPDGYRFWVNKRWCDYTGAEAKQGEGHGWQEFVDPAELARVLTGWRSALAAGEAWECTFPLRRHDGQLRWHLSRAVPLKDSDGEVISWFGTNTDVQDRIDAEQALQDADARKDHFLATLAHELRNPLSPICNALQLWPDVADDPAELVHLRGVIERQVRQLIHLVDDLMDMARITRAKIHLRLAAIDLSTAIAGAIEMVRPRAEEHKQRLSIETTGEPVFVRGDATRLTQVFSNILNNAAEYSGRNSAISIAVAKEKDQAIVRIRDNGPGIPAEMLSEIFAEFRQVDGTLTRSHGGLGIGLWLAKQLVELHGGSIEAHSEGIGRGSEFVVTLPALTTPEAVEDAEGGAFKRPTPRGRVSRHRVLVVDDFHDSAETLAMLLSALGQEATAVHDGKTAIEWAAAHRPDAVFLDIAMPGMDGYEVARRLRAHLELEKTTLVALTGYGQPEDSRKAREAGFNLHLTKPTSIEALEDILRGLSVVGTAADLTAR